MMRDLSVALAATAILAGCGSSEPGDARPEREARRDTVELPAMDSAGLHADHTADADPHAGHRAADDPAPTGSDEDAHAGHRATPAAGRAAAGEHAGHRSAASGGNQPAAGAGEHEGHQPARTAGARDRGRAGHEPGAETRAATDDPHAGHRMPAPQPAPTGQLAADPVTLDPERNDAMAKLLGLVRALTEDPAVQARIQADPSLRELWNQPAVRERIQIEGHHH